MMAVSELTGKNLKAAITDIFRGFKQRIIIGNKWGVTIKKWKPLRYEKNIQLHSPLAFS